MKFKKANITQVKDFDSHNNDIDMGKIEKLQLEVEKSTMKRFIADSAITILLSSLVIILYKYFKQ